MFHFPTDFRWYTKCRPGPRSLVLFPLTPVDTSGLDTFPPFFVTPVVGPYLSVSVPYGLGLNGGQCVYPLDSGSPPDTGQVSVYYDRGQRSGPIKGHNLDNTSDDRHHLGVTTGRDLPSHTETRDPRVPLTDLGRPVHRSVLKSSSSLPGWDSVWLAELYKSSAPSLSLPVCLKDGQARSRTENGPTGRTGPLPFLREYEKDGPPVFSWSAFVSSPVCILKGFPCPLLP